MCGVRCASITYYEIVISRKEKGELCWGRVASVKVTVGEKHGKSRTLAVVNVQ